MNWDFLDRLSKEASFKFYRRVSNISIHAPEDFYTEILIRAADKREQPAFMAALEECNTAVVRKALANIAVDIISEWNAEVEVVAGSLWTMDDVRTALHGGTARPGITEALEALSDTHKRVLTLAALESKDYAVAVLNTNYDSFRARVSRALKHLNYSQQTVSRSVSFDETYTTGMSSLGKPSRRIEY